MNALQAKILAAVFIPLGLASAGYGGYQLFLAWDHNQELKESDNALGGLLSSVTNALGADMTMPYTQPVIFLGAGLFVFLLGWLALGRVR
ncbi:MAG: hypothetical protein R3309_17255 [Reinekea sp.]|nr:hypothetical protein [Reinekea sp.]